MKRKALTNAAADADADAAAAAAPAPEPAPEPAAAAAATAAEPEPEPAPPEVLIERKAREIDQQNKDRNGLETKQRDDVASLPADRWTTVEGNPVLLEIFVNDPRIKAASSEAREAGLAWLKTVRFLTTTDGLAAIVDARHNLEGIPCSSQYMGGMIVEWFEMKANLKRYKRANDTVKARYEFADPAAVAAAMCLPKPEAGSSHDHKKDWKQTLVTIGHVANPNQQRKKSFVTRIPYGSIPAGAKCEVRRAAEPDQKAFCPIIFDLETKSMIIAYLVSTEGRWRVKVPAALMPDRKQCTILVATAMARVVDHGSFAPHDQGWDADHINGDKLDDRISNVRSVPHETNLENRSVFEMITSNPSRIDVIVTVRSPDGTERRLACVSIAHAADELGMNPGSLYELKNGTGRRQSIGVTRPARFAGWRAVRVDDDPGKLAYKALMEVCKRA